MHARDGKQLIVLPTNAGTLELAVHLDDPNVKPAAR